MQPCCNDSQWVNTAFFFLCEVGSLDPWIHCCCRGSFLVCEWQPWWELFGVSTGLNAASCLISFSTGYTVPPFIKGKEWQQYLKWISWLTTSETSTVTYSCSLLQEQLDSLCKSVRLIKFFIECLEKKKCAMFFYFVDSDWTTHSHWIIKKTQQNQNYLYYLWSILLLLLVSVLC